jgi:uncharacterized protein YqjF (DUF2071 family)
MPERPLLTAQWRNLLLLNFAVPTDVVARLLPPGTEPDEHEGQSYISVVGFQFLNVRLLGIPFPFHTRFPEINLRYYVCRTVGNEVRRGVVFAREIVPRRAVAIIANRLYNENYITRHMRSDIQIAGAELSPGDRVEYAWRSARSDQWNQLAASVAAPLAIPQTNSLERFIVDHYWGYALGRDGCAREYRVVHEPWRVTPARDVTWDCELASTYNAPLAEYLATPPTNALVAEGSPIQLFRGQRFLST